MRFFRDFWIVVAGVSALIAALAWIVISPPGPRPPDINFLASDAHFSLAGLHFVVPVVALRGPGHVFDLSGRRTRSLADDIREQARDPAKPKPMDHIDFFIGEYRYTGEHVASVGICPRLTRRWSQVLCRGDHKGLLRRLPEQFDLFDRSKLDLLRNYGTVGGERKYDQIRNMIQAEQVGMGCDRDTKFCTAAIEAQPGVVAVWTVWSNEQTGVTARQMADTQGPAIVQFVRRAIGEVEDLTLPDVE
jgi:hypothetical protein